MLERGATTKRRRGTKKRREDRWKITSERFQDFALLLVSDREEEVRTEA